MATSTVKLYNNKLMRAENNYMYSEKLANSHFAEYLENKSVNKTTISDFQYIKHGLDIVIKINQDQTQINKTNSSQWTYCSIKNSDDDRTYYYFIIGMQWKAQKTIAVSLSMDTIATFWNEIQNDLTDKTNVIREHRDRFYKVTGSITDGTKLIRKIDPISEGIQIANKRLVSDKIINDEELPTDVNKWYLVYRTEVNANDLNNNPINCYLCANKQLNLADSDDTFNLSELDQTRVYLWPNNSNNTNINKNLEYKRVNYDITFTLTVNSVNYCPFLVYLNNQWCLYFRVEESDNWQIHYVKDYVKSNLFSECFSMSYTYFNENICDVENINTNKPDKKTLINIGDNINSTQILFTNLIQDITYIDRTDSRLNMIIELPYCPDDTIYHTTLTDIYSFNKDIWEYSGVNRMLRLKDLNSTFYRTLQQEYEVPDLVYTANTNELSNNSNNENKLESKIYHSDFSQLQYIYDNFPISVDRERLIVNEINTSDPTYTLGYKQANNLTSNLLMEVKESQNGKIQLSEIANHEFITISTRNNEIPTYQSAYLNYMRTGYNYDKKAQSISNRQQTYNLVSGISQTVLSSITGGIDFASNIQSISGRLKSLRYSSGKNSSFALPNIEVSHNEDFLQSAKVIGIGTQLAISNVFNAINSISSAIATRQSQENSMNAKLAELSMQQASTSGSNDLDLFNYYDQNKLHELKYELTDNMKEPIYDLFYYLGYATNIQKKPDLYSRSLFNYIMATPEFNLNNDVIFNEYLLDIKARFASGLTIWHNQNVWTYGLNNTEKWVIDQLPTEEE